jgi:hypothetical protein
MNFIENKFSGRGGQAMILTVTMIGGMFLSATAIAGLLMFYQLQQANDAGNSTVAVFAADAVLETATYYYFNTYQYNPATCLSNPCPDVTVSGPTFSNGATASAKLTVPMAGTPNARTLITATGNDQGNRTVRLLQTSIFINQVTP